MSKARVAATRDRRRMATERSHRFFCGGRSADHAIEISIKRIRASECDRAYGVHPRLQRPHPEIENGKDTSMPPTLMIFMDRSFSPLLIYTAKHHTAGFVKSMWQS
jgi:hypothetical protein